MFNCAARRFRQPKSLKLYIPRNILKRKANEQWEDGGDNMPRKKALATQNPPAIVLSAPNPKSYELTAEEVNLLKNSICKGASDDELKFCLTVARRYEFDPFQKQIWFVKRWDSQAMASDGKKGAHIWVPVVSVDGLCYQAA